MHIHEEIAHHFITRRNLLSSCTPEGLAVLKMYLERGKPKEIPQLPGALGFDPESEGLEILFDKEESAQAALTILSGLLNA